MARQVATSRNLLSEAPIKTSGLHFGNTNAIVTVGNNNALKNLTAVTIEAFINNGSLPAALTRICEYGATANKGFNFCVNASGSNSILQANIGNATVLGNLQVGIVTRQKWTHVAVSWDGSTIRMFVNGTLQGTTTAMSGGNTGDPASSLYIGNRSAGDRGFQGIMQELRISNTARYTASFTPPTAAFTTDANTIGLWHMNEGSGTSIADSSGNGLTGTASGSPLPLWSGGYLPTSHIVTRSIASGRQPREI